MSRPLNVLRVCLVTGGGDAPGLNAAVRAFVHAATHRSVLVHASSYGFEGLLGRESLVAIRPEDVRGILPRGGSILGCSTRSNPFADSDGGRVKEAVTQVRCRLDENGIAALVLAGGDGTMAIAQRLGALGVPCIGIPKTIDGDLGGTERTIGLDTAIETATRAIDALHSTAEAHRRALVVEVMGRYAGWIALCAGLAGGADAILIPEVAYDVERVVAKIRERDEFGLRFSIVVVGEGAHPKGAAASELEHGKAGHPARLGGAGQRLADALVAQGLPHDVRVTVLGHLQRGGTPTASDRLLATRLGAHAAELCAARRFGRMVCLHNGRVDSISIDQACRISARVSPEHDLLRSARMLGIELGHPDNAPDETQVAS
jgi:6-phosphofructokinase 1